MNTWLDGRQWSKSQYPLMSSLNSQAPPRSATEHRLNRAYVVQIRSFSSWSSLFPPPPSPPPPPPEKRKKIKKYPCATTFRSSRSHITVSFSFQSVKFVCKIRFRFRVWISLWHGTNMWCLTKPSQVGIITENINNTKRQRVFLCNWFTEASH